MMYFFKKMWAAKNLDNTMDNSIKQLKLACILN